MIRLGAFVVVLLFIAFVPFSFQKHDLRVGSKKFTESVVLGELLRLLIEDAGSHATHFRELGGTKLVYESLLNGEIDVYAEYTGTIREESLSGEAETVEQMRDVLRRQGVTMSKPIGFNNTYAIAMRKSRARELGIQKISDLKRHPNLKFGFSNEFMDRDDGWPNLRLHYDLVEHQASGLDHDLFLLKCVNNPQPVATAASVIVSHNAK